MDKEKLSRISVLALNRIFGYEPKLSHHIIDTFGSPEAVFSLSGNEMRSIFGPYSKYLPLINGQALENAEKELDRLTSDGYSILSICDSAYPELLKECEDSPVALYVRSGTDAGAIFNKHPAVSIVGTRDISPYGKEWCERIVSALSRSPIKPLIVSGLAIGVDITAHMAALCCGLPTVGVLPVGITDIYPLRHSVAAGKIAGSPGSALVTDYPPGTHPATFNFLRRNRIIAGLSRATILVESKAKGGGTMTARLAFDYGRDVFALPGRIDDIRSTGCNRLIKEEIAAPIDSLETLVESLGLGSVADLPPRVSVESVRECYDGILDAEDRDAIAGIFLAVKEHRGICPDELCRICNMDYARVSRLTGILENDGFIETDVLQRCTINAKKQ